MRLEVSVTHTCRAYSSNKGIDQNPKLTILFTITSSVLLMVSVMSSSLENGPVTSGMLY